MVTKRKAITVKEFKKKRKGKDKWEKAKAMAPAFCGLSGLIVWVGSNLRDEENEKVK
jgi:hypothetical protein